MILEIGITGQFGSHSPYFLGPWGRQYSCALVISWSWAWRCTQPLCIMF